jgi:hypothetical protein
VKQQNKIIEICASGIGLGNPNPMYFGIQNEAEKFRLRKLKLVSLQSQLVLDAAYGPGTYGKPKTVQALTN